MPHSIPLKRVRIRSLRALVLLLILVTLVIGSARSEELPLKIFGYFQTELRQDNDSGHASN
ncbi:MAG TPA: hypothetical protein VHP63_02655, partial [candidate division Zixibacteria bacterium]|nr:hypothetical protein [candidate division Zixibacteria bacterium]